LTADDIISVLYAAGNKVLFILDTFDSTTQTNTEVSWPSCVGMWGMYFYKSGVNHAVGLFLYNEEAVFELVVYSLKLGAEPICISKTKIFSTFRLKMLPESSNS